MDDSYVTVIGFCIEPNRADTAVRITYPGRAWPRKECFAVPGDARAVARRVRRVHRLRLLRRLGLCALVSGVAVTAAIVAVGAHLGTWPAVALGLLSACLVYALDNRPVGTPDMGGVGVPIPGGLFDRLEAPERDALMRLVGEDVVVQMEAGRMVLGDYEQADRRNRLEGQQQAREVARRLLYGQD